MVGTFLVLKALLSAAAMPRKLAILENAADNFPVMSTAWMWEPPSRADHSPLHQQFL